MGLLSTLFRLSSSLANDNECRVSGCFSFLECCGVAGGWAGSGAGGEGGLITCAVARVLLHVIFNLLLDGLAL